MLWEHALASCRQRNETVIFPNTTATISQLKKFMKDNDINKAWIGLTLTKLRVPAWETKNYTGFIYLLILHYFYTRNLLINITIIGKKVDYLLRLLTNYIHQNTFLLCIFSYLLVYINELLQEGSVT